MLLSPGSPVLKVVKHVVIKSAPNLMWSSIRERIVLFTAIVVRTCGHFQATSAHLRLSYCNSFKSVCQEVSGVNIWDAVIKDKVPARNFHVHTIALKKWRFYGII